VKTKIEIKEEMAAEVAKKVALTKDRLAIKRVPFSERSPESHQRMLWLGNEATCQKETCRFLQLAYAFVRGVPYWVQERYAKDLPYARTLAQYAGVEESEIQAWLDAPVDDEERASFEHYVEVMKAAARERKLSRVRARGAA
jgi:hypothetical protein